MANEKSINPGKLILQAIILVSILLVYYSDYASAGGGPDAFKEFQKRLFLQSLVNQGGLDSNNLSNNSRTGS